MYTAGGIDSIYVKNGAKLIMTGGIHVVLYENFSDLTLSGGISATVACTSISLDYTNAPTNGCSPILPVLGSIVNVDPICEGDCSGNIDLTHLSGIPPYTYQWSNGANTQDLEDLCVGSYIVTVTDANGLQESSKKRLRNRL